MKIKKIQIENFRCYYGIHNVNFDTDGKTTLIYGLSGAGKSSFLHFINWVLYNNNDFSNNSKKYGKTLDDKPLYNKKACAETTRNNTFETKGIIEFEHNNVQYKMIRKNIYKKMFNDAELEDYTVALLYSNKGNWEGYQEDIPTKINEIVPRALSKYFFFHGEKMADLSEDDSEIKDAIYSMFGIKQYEMAIKHLGDKSESYTVLGKYYNDMNKSVKNLCGDDPVSINAQIGAYRLAKKQFEAKMNEYLKLEKKYELRNSEVLAKLGKIQSSSAFEGQISSNKKLIDQYEKDIQEYKYKLGNCLYSCVPYLILSELTGNSVKLLAKEVSNQEDKREVVFRNLKKDLLKEIIEKNICICNRELDDKSKKHIQDTIDSMPPDSYTYQLKQFAAKSSDYLSKSIEEFDEYNNILSNITFYRKKIMELEETNKNLTEELKKLSETKGLAEEYEKNNASIKNYDNLAKDAKSKMNRSDELAEQTEKKYNEAIKSAQIKQEFKEKIEILESIKNNLKINLNNRVVETKKVLHENIKSVYKVLSTRVEEKEPIFLKDNFGLREENLTGGQTVIDVYSYIIGMISSLTQFDDETKENEFPIIIDAPFSHTDIIQASRVFTTLPTVASQVIMLSLELDKFKDSINSNYVGNTYYIDTDETQEVAKIVPCTIDEMLSLAEKNAERAKERK